MPFWQEWKPAYGMHWGFVKPYPCTHGCIRLPMKAAAKIFAMTRVGTPLLKRITSTTRRARDTPRQGASPQASDGVLHSHT